MFRVLLYYKYVKITNPDDYVVKHLDFCRSLGVSGRVIIAEEGINGTISGTVEQNNKYIEFMHSDPRFADMEFKIDVVEHHAFKRLSVRLKKELVSFRYTESIDPSVCSGIHLNPNEFYEALQDEDIIILDGRTDYEYDLGHFRNAVRPGVRSFRDFPEWIKANFSKYKEKKILTYCTGGVRCEKLTGFMLKEGFKNVFQLEGGIINYSHNLETRGKLFEGKCYVFDERISIPINYAEEYKIVSCCHHCSKPTDRYVNCANIDCHKQHFECEECEKKYHRSCSIECMDAPRHEFT